MDKKYIKSVIGSFVLTLIIPFVSCSDEYTVSDNISNDKVLVELCLNVPGLTSNSTRSMSTAQESGIDDTKIQVLVFEKSGNAEVFSYQADITNKNLPNITLQVPVSEGSKQYRLVVLANVEPETITEGSNKESVLQQFTFSCLGKWNASNSNPAPIPMWGELSELITITNNRSANILLHRALARVDIGLLYKFNNPDPVSGAEYDQKETDKESVYGLDHFKIKDIRVYRTKSQAYAASSEDNMSGNEIIMPSIPASANYNTGSGTAVGTLENADSDPLLYTLPAAGNSYIREIYVPESNLIDSQSDMDNVPCLVIGGYYGTTNTTEVTYYRADFATYNNGTVSSYRPILRNHQYVFDIKTVNGPGFETPEQALHSISSPMKLNIVEWNQIPLGFYVQGHYFLSVEENTIWLEARIQGDLTENSYTVSYQTNLALDGTAGNEFTTLWASTGTSSSSYFNQTIDYVNKTIKFTPLSDNTTANELRTDTIRLIVENLELNITVKQKGFNLNYTIDCESVKVNGKYRENVSLNYSNYIEVKVKTQGFLNGETYEIKTLEKNGIYFLGSGTFNRADATPLGNGKFEYTIKLEGYGTPVNEDGTDVFKPFNVTIVKNTVNNEYCSARIIIGYKTKRILTIGANAAYRYGYMLEPNTASRAFVDASVNFGVDPNSIVTIEENQYGNAFTIDVMTVEKGMFGEIIDYNYLKNKLNTFKPEIILTGQAINYNSSGGDAIQLLSDFVDAGGVFIMCNEYYPDMSSINSMVQKIMGTGVIGTNQSIGSDQLFTLSGDENDMIVNGPFGDMRGKQWGADGHEMQGFLNLSDSESIIYSSRTDGYINMFRHATKPFFFIGEGGFISNPQRYIGEAYQGSYVYCPFAIDETYSPIPRVNYTVNMSSIVYNSQIFGNILAWAVDWSEMNGIDYSGTDKKFP
ncbi:hypothetical protein [Massilibacteroides sp.]|uniref:hypothetical protein n=1 Tax=Massilibacteroides sp. TaxID=2034766 RepID=UPI002619588C|nr:hypothetical protein [Massilibacteroides sp.]MDD4516688.1 hypothetical protein [Massilibacteroides sp.]